MSVLAELSLGVALAAIFWGHMAAALLNALGIWVGTQYAFVVSGLSFLWGYTLDRATRQTPPVHQHRLVLAGWILPVFLFGILLAATWAGPRVFPWGITVSTEAGVYLVLWAICSVQGINRARTTNLSTLQRNSLLGTLILAVIASFQQGNRLSLATGALVFALVSSLNIALLRQRKVLGTIEPEQRRYWMSGGVVFLALILALAAFASMGGPGAASWVWQFVKKAWSLIGILFIYVSIPVAWVAEWIVVRLRQIMNWDPPEMQEAQPFLNQALERLQEEGGLSETPLWAHVILVVAALTVVLWLIWRFLLKHEARRKQDSPLAETRMSLLEKGAFRDWAESSTNEFASRMRDNMAKFLYAIQPNRPKTIQELYFYSLEVIGKRVFPREQNETPFEYLDDILEHVSCEEGRQAFDYITALFCKCYYSHCQPQPSEWEKAVHAYWVLTQPETLRLQPPSTGQMHSP